MAKRTRKVDPVLLRSFNEFYRTLDHGPVTSYGHPVKSIRDIREHFGISLVEIEAWRPLAFPIYNVKGGRAGEKWYANPERVMAWFRWRDLVQSGYIQVDLAAQDS